MRKLKLIRTESVDRENDRFAILIDRIYERRAHRFLRNWANLERCDLGNVDSQERPRAQLQYVRHIPTTLAFRTACT